MMLKCQDKGVKQALKDFLSGVRKMVRLCEAKAFVAGRSSSGNRRSQLLRHVKPESLSQQTSSVRGTP
jgi:hypothetical protein